MAKATAFVRPGNDPNASRHKIKARFKKNFKINRKELDSQKVGPLFIN
jgi:hypothetical protein